MAVGIHGLQGAIGSFLRREVHQWLVAQVAGWDRHIQGPWYMSLLEGQWSGGQPLPPAGVVSWMCLTQDAAAWTFLGLILQAPTSSIRYLDAKKFRY